MGGRRRLKRAYAPRTWKLSRKVRKWTTKPIPGPHNKQAIPLIFVVRDYLKYARNARETKKILNEGCILVDGKVRRDLRFPVGVMDVIEIPKTKEVFRILPDHRARLELLRIDPKEKNLKLLKIVNKFYVKERKSQLNFHDGSNLLIEDDYATSDSILYDFDAKKIKNHIPFKVGKMGYVVRGRNAARSGKIKEIKSSGIYNDICVLEAEETFQTLKEYVFAVGGKKSVINLR